MVTMGGLGGALHRVPRAHADLMPRPSVWGMPLGDDITFFCTFFGTRLVFFRVLAVRCFWAKKR